MPSSMLLLVSETENCMISKKEFTASLGLLLLSLYVLFCCLCMNLSNGQFTECWVVFHHVYNSILFRERIQVAGHSGGSAITTIIHLTDCSLLSSMMAFRERLCRLNHLHRRLLNILQIRTLHHHIRDRIIDFVISHVLR